MGDELLDMVVVGGGLAGLTAATRASEGGLAPVVLEQGSQERYPCNSRSSGGILHVAYNDVSLPPHVLAAAVRKAMDADADEALIEAVSRRAGPALQWVQSHGARFVKASPTPWHRWMLAPPRPMQAGLDFPGRGPDRLVSTLAADSKANGGQLLLGHQVKSVERAAHGFNVAVATPQGPRDLRTKALVLADGGFQGDAQLMRRHIGPRPEHIVQRGAGTGRGTAVRIGEALGCGFSRMDRFYGHPLSRDALTNPALWPYPMLDTLVLSCMVVDREGRRIVDEGRGGIHLANFLAKLDDPASCFLVLDQAIWESAGRESLLPANPHLETGGATILRASDPAGLAALAGIDAQGLAATLDEYNWATQAGPDALAALEVARTGSARVIGEGLLMAIPMAPGITNTMGGISVDADARALDTYGAPIPGLYAVGASAGGLEGGAQIGYVGGLMRGLTSGLAAAEHVLVAAGRNVPSVMAAAPAHADASAPLGTGARRGPSVRVLRLITRNAQTFAAASALLAAVGAGCIGALAGAAFAVVLALGAGVGGYLLAAAFAEMAAIILDMLVPD